MEASHVLTVPCFPTWPNLLSLPCCSPFWGLHPWNCFTELHLLPTLTVALPSSSGAAAHKAASPEWREAPERKTFSQLFPKSYTKTLMKAFQLLLSCKPSKNHCKSLIRQFCHLLTFPSGTSRIRYSHLDGSGGKLMLSPPLFLSSPS